MGLGERAAEEGRRNNLVVYARRKARSIFLKCYVGEDHPVLVAENILVEMARSKLLEGLLASAGEEGLTPVRPETERAIRDEMKLSLARLVSDPEKAAALQAEAELVSMDSVFTPRGA